VSVKVTTWVWEHSRSRGPARLVLLAIADNAHDDGAQAWPSITTLIRKTGHVERTVQEALKALQELGELEIDYNGGPRRCNLYRVVMGTPAGDAPPQEMHPAGDAGVQEVHPYPAGDAGVTPQEMHPEPSIEPSRNRQKTNTVVDQARPGTLPTPDAIRQVWETYLDARQTVGLSINVRLTPKRRDKIRARLKAAPLQDVLDAAQGWTRDPWPERRQHCDAIHIFKSDEQVEKFRDLWRDGPPQVMGKQMTEMARIAQDMTRHRPGKEATNGDLGRMDRNRAVAQRQLSRPEG
jgi:hypothetical protein